jgi:XTP/dITP diphosphohydrolase
VSALRFFLATGNAHKAREFAALARALGSGPVEILAAGTIGGMPAVPEDTGTFVGNARQKARALLPRLPADAWALADDSGLCVDALGGGPGVDSAIYAGPQADSIANLAKLVGVMREVPDGYRGAQFVCLLVALRQDGREMVGEGRCPGRLLREPAGPGGFGYDPIFVPEGVDRSFAELGEEGKRSLSHRAMAWRRLVDQI